MFNVLSLIAEASGELQAQIIFGCLIRSSNKQCQTKMARSTGSQRCEVCLLWSGESSEVAVPICAAISSSDKRSLPSLLPSFVQWACIWQLHWSLHFVVFLFLWLLAAADDAAPRGEELAAAAPLDFFFFFGWAIRLGDGPLWLAAGVLAGRLLLSNGMLRESLNCWINFYYSLFFSSSAAACY